MGIYLVINLELSSIPVAHWWGGRRTGVEFPDVLLGHMGY